MTALYLTLSLLISAAPDAWPGFLNGGRAPQSSQILPLTWSPDENIAWTADIPGYGQSSPIVWGGKVYVTSIEGSMKEKCHVLALDLQSGKQLWKHTLDASTQAKNSTYVSRAAPTPVTDGEAVYVFFESGDVVALSPAGKTLWQRSLVGDYGQFQGNHGLAASPVLTGDAVILLVDHSGPSYLLALSKSDGGTLWKTDRTSRVSWSSPSLVPVEGGYQVVCSSSGSVDGYNPDSGKLLWSVDDLGGNTTNTALPFKPGTFLVGASAGRGGDDGGAARRSNLAMTIKTIAGKSQAEVLWRTDEATSSFGSPVVHRGVAYWVNRSGVVYAFDAESGESLFTKRTSGSCWATPLGVGDRVYVIGKDGTTTVLKAGKEFQVLAENKLWNAEDEGGGRFSGPVQYAAAAVSDNLLIRTGDRLYCLRQAKPTESE